MATDELDQTGMRETIVGTDPIVIPLGGTSVLSVDPYAHFAPASTPTPAWIATEVSGIYINSVHVNSNGDVFKYGTDTVGSITLYNADGADSGLVTPVKAGNGNGVLVMYSASGIVQWVAAVRRAIPSKVFATSTAVYICGSYVTPSLVINSDGTTTVSLPSETYRTSYVVAFNLSGIAQWTSILYNDGSNSAVGGLAVSDTALYITYTINATYDITFLDAEGSPSGLTLTASSGQSVAVVTYSLAGTSTGVVTARSTSGDVGMQAVALSSDGLSMYIVGTTSGGTVTIHGSTDATFTTVGTFVAKITISDLAVQWTASITHTQAGRIVVNSDDGSLYVLLVTVGHVLPVIRDAGDGAGVSMVPSADTYMVAFNTSGISQWSAALVYGYCYGCTMVNSHIVLACAAYAPDEPVIYDSTGSPSTTVTLTAPGDGDGDGYLVYFDTDGMATGFSYFASVGGDDEPAALAAHPDGTSLVMAGVFHNGCVFAGSTINYPEIMGDGGFTMLLTNGSGGGSASLPDGERIGDEKLLMFEQDDATAITVEYTGGTAAFNKTGQTLRLIWSGSAWFVRSSNGVTL